MAKGIREIRRQIKSIQSTRQITRAMEMVAASKLRRAEMTAQAARPYADKIREVISSIANATEGLSHPMLESREVRRTGYVVITSDRGLAGGYNSNLLRMLLSNLEKRHNSPDEYSISVLGSKGRDFLRNRGYSFLEEITGLPDSPTFSDIKPLAATAVKHFTDEKYDEVYLVYNEFINALSQNPIEKKLLPLDRLSEELDADDLAETDYIYEPLANDVLNELLPRYAETLIYSALLEAKASEFGARMTAMGNASKSATEMIDSLTLSFNRARQAAITQEISEIVAGANAVN